MVLPTDLPTGQTEAATKGYSFHTNSGGGYVAFNYRLNEQRLQCSV
jgi:hypothetical protein